jgi:N-sulfoglucosamine sulfohydrolase-like protein
MGSHLGGTRNPMVVAWPNRIKAGGDLRTQFTHCIDVGPTVLELAGIPEPTTVDGIEQEPMDGTSFAYTLDDAKADERHTVQYFEMLGSKAIYKDGWWACAKLDKIPWDFTPETMARFAPGKYDPEEDVWELYYLPDDFSQARNLAAENPDKVKELKELFYQEAERNRALPLLAAFSVWLGDLPPLPTITRYTYAGDVQNIQTTMIPRIYGRSYAIEAEITVPERGAEGVLVAFADFIGGFSLWVDEKGLLNHTYQLLGVETYKQTSTKPIPTGEVTVKMLFEIDEPRPGSGGNVTLWANDEQIGEGRMPHSISLIFTTYAGMDVGRDNGGVVDLAYEEKAPYAFSGTVKQVVFDLKPPTTHEDEKALHAATQQAGVANGVAG